MNEIIANSWDELQNLLFDGSWNPEIGRFRSPFVYRGLSSKHFDLKTSLMRLGGEYWKLERHLLRNFKKYGHNSFGKPGSFWHWLTVAQHHGLPTRLLDWTYSPFVSMHFATSNIEMANTDGAIWKINYHESAKQLPSRLKKCLSNEGSNVFTEEMLLGLVNSLKDFDLLSKKDFFLFYEPPSINPRIVNQFALFSIASSAKKSMDEIAFKQLDGATKIIIPADLKWEIRDKLDQANITERVLFPGLDGLSAWLKRHYTPVQ